MTGPRGLERLIVVAVALHSLAVGAVLLAMPRFGLELGGWGRISPIFFPMQGGAFHVVLGIGYLMEYERHRTVTLILVAKGLATLFLTTAALTYRGALPWSLPVSAAGDAMMGALVAWAHARAQRATATATPAA